MTDPTDQTPTSGEIFAALVAPMFTPDPFTPAEADADADTEGDEA